VNKGYIERHVEKNIN